MIGSLGSIPFPRIPSDLTNKEGMEAFVKAMKVIRDHLASLGFMVDKTTSSASLSSLAKAHGVSKEALAQMVKQLKAQEKRKGKDSKPGVEEKKKKKKRKAEDSNPGGGEKKNKKKKASDDDDDDDDE